MSEMALQRDIGAYIAPEPALIPNVVVSGDNPDGVEQNGVNLDRLKYTPESEPPLSAQLALNFNLAGGTTIAETWTVHVQVQDGPTTTAYTDVLLKDQSTAFDATIVFDTDDAAFVADSVLRVDVNLAGLRQHVRAQVTPAFVGTTAATKILNISGQWITGGSNIIPAA